MRPDEKNKYPENPMLVQFRITETAKLVGMPPTTPEQGRDLLRQHDWTEGKVFFALAYPYDRGRWNCSTLPTEVLITPMRTVGLTEGRLQIRGVLIYPRPNQSLEPTRVGEPPLAAQLQR